MTVSDGCYVCRKFGFVRDLAPRRSRSLEPARLLTPAMTGGSTCTASRHHPRSQLSGKTPLEIRFGEADSMAVAF